MALSIPGGERGSIPQPVIEQASSMKTKGLPMHETIFVAPRNWDETSSGLQYLIRQGDTTKVIRHDQVFFDSSSLQEDPRLTEN